MTALTASSHRSSVNVIWALLMLTTLASWWLGTDHLGAREAATVGVLVLAFVKVQMVGMYFMEVRHATAVLKTLFAAWTALVCSTLVILYLAL